MDCSVLCWDYRSGRVLESFSTQPSASSLAAGGGSGAAGTQMLNPPFVHSMAFSRDGLGLYVASGNGEIILIDPRRKKETKRVMGHTHSVMHV